MERGGIKEFFGYTGFSFGKRPRFLAGLFIPFGQSTKQKKPPGKIRRGFLLLVFTIYYILYLPPPGRPPPPPRGPRIDGSISSFQILNCASVKTVFNLTSLSSAIFWRAAIVAPLSA